MAITNTSEVRRRFEKDHDSFTEIDTRTNPCKPTSRREEKPSFHCCEMVLGKLLGKGAFCEVHELLEVRLLTRTELSICESPLVENDNPREEASRNNIYHTCHDAMGKSQYVVKHLRSDLTSKRGVKIFQHAAVDCLKECDILSSLSHKNIVELHGSAVLPKQKDNDYNQLSCASHRSEREYQKIIAETNPEAFFLVLEKLDQTLTDRIRHWIVSPKRQDCNDDRHGNGGMETHAQDSNLPLHYTETLRFAQDIASALAHLHKHGMVFRDLKPDNVGITKCGTAKLLDFGLCRSMPGFNSNDRRDSDSSGSTTSRSSRRRSDPMYLMSTVGTRRYMSPEMIAGRGYNQKTDCYSWAMVFYEMLSLQKPYAQYNRAAHKVHLCENQGRPPMGGWIPGDSKHLLKRAWAQSTVERLTMQEILDELETMIPIVEQQSLPLIERSLRAVLEMAALISLDYDNHNTAIPCLASDCTLCEVVDDDTNDLDGKKSPTMCTSPQKLSATELSITTADRGVIAAE